MTTYKEKVEEVLNEFINKNKDAYTDCRSTCFILQEALTRIQQIPEDTKQEQSRYEIAFELYIQFVEENPYRTNFREWLEEKKS